MRRALQDTKENLTEFVQQADYCLLLIGTADNDVPWVLKVQEQLAAETPGTLYFAFADEFTTKEAYALAIAKRLELMLALENEQRRADGRAALDPFPESMLAAHTAPKERLRIAFQHMTRWLTDLGEQRVVMTLMPLGEPPPGYYRFVCEFAIYDAVREPWMDNGRIIARDERATHVTSLALYDAQADGMLAFDVNFSTDAMAASMAQDAADPSLSLAERMQNHLQLAMIDMSYKRYDESIQKYVVLYEYYARLGAPLMQALCILGVGDCLRIAGQPKAALEKYQQGLALALNTKPPVHVPAPPLADGSPNPNPGLHPSSPPILLNLLLGAGETSMSLGEYRDSESYYDSASRMAARCMNPFAAADALERQGDAALARGDHGAALAAWTDADNVAKSCKYYERRESVLGRQKQLYESAHMYPKAAGADREIELVRYLREHPELQAKAENAAKAGEEGARNPPSPSAAGAAA
ncbi:MAG TPA: hypothetical protein VFU02_19885 [Polyangiaceae bacterium]|nr:hypothetical protein [Polyangiaceae bacterium]